MDWLMKCSIHLASISSLSPWISFGHGRHTVLPNLELPVLSGHFFCFHEFSHRQFSVPNFQGRIHRHSLQQYPPVLEVKAFFLNYILLSCGRNGEKVSQYQFSYWQIIKQYLLNFNKLLVSKNSFYQTSVRCLCYTTHFLFYQLSRSSTFVFVQNKGYPFLIFVLGYNYALFIIPRLVFLYLQFIGLISFKSFIMSCQKSFLGSS